MGESGQSKEYRKNKTKLQRKYKLLKIAISILESIPAKETTIHRYYAKQKGVLDELSANAKAEDKGERIGQMKVKAEVATKALKDNMDVELIVKITGLKEEEIEQIKSNM